MPDRVAAKGKGAAGGREPRILPRHRQQGVRRHGYPQPARPCRREFHRRWHRTCQQEGREQAPHHPPLVHPGAGFYNCAARTGYIFQ